MNSDPFGIHAFYSSVGVDELREHTANELGVEVLCAVAQSGTTNLDTITNWVFHVGNAVSTNLLPYEAMKELIAGQLARLEAEGLIVDGTVTLEAMEIVTEHLALEGDNYRTLM